MKKNYFLLAATTMMFAACAQTDMVNEVVTEEAPQAIGFETFAQKATRAAGEREQAENSTAKYANGLLNHHESFNVWASKKVTTGYVTVYNPGVVEGSLDNSSNEVWTPTSLKYWDKTATSYEFYAAAPALDNSSSTYGWVWTPIAESNNTTTGGYLTFNNYVLTGASTDNLASVSSQNDSWKDLTSAADKDLMIADKCPVLKAAYNKTTPDAVNLDFIHILSRLNIQVKTTDDAPTIVLKGLDVCGLKNKGTFTENATLTTGTTLDGGTYERWGTPTTNGTYTLSAYLGANNATSLQLTSTAAYTHKYLIIPQTVTGRLANANIASAPRGESYLKINYTVGTDADAEDYETYYSLAAAFDQTSLAFNEGWQNTLTITIAPQTITFTGNVAPWADGTTKDNTTIE